MIRAALACAGTVSACALTSKAEVVTPRYFSPEPMAGGHSPKVPEKLELRLGEVSSASHLDERIAYRVGGAEMGFYEDQRWTENPEAYRRSSPVNFSSQLQNRLLIMHGIVDNNVLFQEAVQLTEKLIHEGKSFDEAFYPEENHGFVREESLKDAFGRAGAFFDRHLNEHGSGAPKP